MNDPQSRDAELRARFAEIDEHAKALSVRTGMHCPPGCGACCHSPDVEASAAECGPLAERLVAEGGADDVLAAIAQRWAEGDRRCALFAAGEGDAGRCTRYADRPIVCRLFGFSARLDRRGQPELIACRVLRSASPESVRRAEQDVRSGGAVALACEHARAGGGAFRTQVLPINDALAAAIGRAILRARLASFDEPSGEDAGASPGPARATSCSDVTTPEPTGAP